MVKLVKDENNNIVSLELWGASTKHPDSVFYLKDFNKSYMVESEQCAWNIYQWLIECASKLSFPPHTFKLVSYANDYIINYIMESDSCDREEATETLYKLALA